MKPQCLTADLSMCFFIFNQFPKFITLSRAPDYQQSLSYSTLSYVRRVVKLIYLSIFKINIDYLYVYGRKHANLLTTQLFSYKILCWQKQGWFQVWVQPTGQWGTPLQINTVHHWLGANLQSALRSIYFYFTLAFRSHCKLPYLQVLKSFTCKRLLRRLRTTKFLLMVQALIFVWKWGCKCFMCDKVLILTAPPLLTGPKVKIYLGVFWPPRPLT